MDYFGFSLCKVTEMCFSAFKSSMNLQSNLFFKTKKRNIDLWEYSHLASNVFVRHFCLCCETGKGGYKERAINLTILGRYLANSMPLIMDVPMIAAAYMYLAISLLDYRVTTYSREKLLHIEETILG